ncbi:MAG: protein arginine kinase [Bacillota bacterium]|nr:protein arginine kinase [Bacillota bacterium]
MDLSRDDLFSWPISHWMEGDGPESDVVISSRVRLARNVTGIPFPHLMDDGQAERIISMVSQALAGGPADEPGPTADLHLVRLSDLGSLQRAVLVEKHLISPLHAAGARGAAVIRGDQAVSIMINEEDHLRIQVLFPALQLLEALAVCTAVDDALERHIDYAWDQRLGYLTSCPTNTGTGMRASVMLHLPGLVITNQARRLAGLINKLSCVVRGMYGEGTEAAGNVFQVSNQITMGQTEEEILSGLQSLTARLIVEERSARRSLLEEMKPQLEDRVWRAWGIMTTARVLSSREAMQLISDLKLGVALGLIDRVGASLVNSIMFMIRPAYLQILAGQELSPDERDIRRAELVRQHLSAGTA